MLSPWNITVILHTGLVIDHQGAALQTTNDLMGADMEHLNDYKEQSNYRLLNVCAI